MKIPGFLKHFNRIFKKAGFQCYLVGGAIRNMISGKGVTDFDFATDATPEEVMNLFHRVIPTGIKHGTVTVLFKGHHLEVTTFRIEDDYSDFRRPDAVHFTPSIHEDLRRRDFTVNAMAYNISNGELLDPHSGREDLKNNVIRAIGDPEERFFEDPLRMLRACRFASQLNFTIEEGTLEGIRRKYTLIRNVSSERIRDEFIKIVTSNFPGKGLLLMDTTGLMDIIIPELTACKDVPQKGMHKFDVFKHSIAALEFADNDVTIRLAALFHDIGKPDSLAYDENGEPTFHGHETISAQKAVNILGRLRFPKAVENSVDCLIKHHMFSYDNLTSDSSVRRFVARVGRETIPDLFRLRRADSSGIVGTKFYCPNLEDLEHRIDDILKEDTALSVKDLDIDGNILSKEGGIPKGPEMGMVLSYLLDAVIDDPEMNRKEKLLNLGKNYYNEYIAEG